MIESLLQIKIITYNRSQCLDNTLAQLLNSPFASCSITVLDNCSTDGTESVTSKYANYYNDFKIIRHYKNIGGDNNFLRAVELSTAYYTWILCDDDNYDFTYADEIVAVITSRKFDLIYVSSRSESQLDWHGDVDTTVNELIMSGARYHRAVTFIPAMIFRTECFCSYCFFQSRHLFPSMPFVNKTVRYNMRIYVPLHGLVIRTVTNSFEMTPLYFFKEWVESLDSIDNQTIKAEIIEQCTDKGFIKTLCFWIALDRASRVKGYCKTLIDILFGLTPRQRFKLLALFPVMIIPVPISLLLRARELVYRLIGNKDISNLPPVKSVHR